MSRIGQEITNSEDVIDSRAVIDRIEELEAERAPFVDAVEEAETALAEAVDALARAGEGVDTTDLDKAVDDAEIALEKARDALEGFDGFDGTAEGEELTALKALADEAERYADDWRYGVTLIRDSYFEEYAEELAEDIGAIPADAAWPCTCIDWAQAARELKQDYTEVYFDGVSYWVR